MQILSSSTKQKDEVKYRIWIQNVYFKTKINY